MWRGLGEVAGSTSATGGDAVLRPVNYHRVEKVFFDYSEHIEGVNIHYACTPPGESPDWVSQRATRYLPLVEPRLRRKELKLPIRIRGGNGGELTDRYLLHYYFEIFLDGDRHYSPLYTEEVVTGAGVVATSDELAAPISAVAVSRDRAAEGDAASDSPEHAEADGAKRAASGNTALIPETQPPAPASKEKLRPKSRKKIE
jgi:hypothetical protein